MEAWKTYRIHVISTSSMQISIMETSMSWIGHLGLSWGITQPTEKSIYPFPGIVSFLLRKCLCNKTFHTFPDPKEQPVMISSLGKICFDKMPFNFALPNNFSKMANKF